MKRRSAEFGTMPVLITRQAAMAWTEWVIAVPDVWRAFKGERWWRLALAAHMLRWTVQMALGRIR